MTGLFDLPGGEPPEPDPAGPTLAREDWLIAVLSARLGRPARLVAMDEVGRGAIAGPVAVGAIIYETGLGDPPAGVRDSKLLTARRRSDLVTEIESWTSGAVGYGSVEEINSRGIMSAICLAARRAMDQLPPADLILLDGSYNWFRRDLDPPRIPVETMVKGDRFCLSIGAAAILAKVARDALMVSLADERGYSWKSNKGYASKAHVEALRRHGPSTWHRTAWQLPGVDDE
ncbi:MAG: ribonuclease HII [Flaviflexus sp.]|nr:ribonuclease HII [Flaviflexus sp.]